jgi:hypothetical protein
MNLYDYIALAKRPPSPQKRTAVRWTKRSSHLTYTDRILSLNRHRGWSDDGCYGDRWCIGA